VKGRSVAGIVTVVASLGLAAGALFAGSGKEPAGRTPLPAIAVEKSQAGEKCVRDTEWMRRNHMRLLKHQRDDTMYRGVRGTDEALRACINCHADKKTGSVIGSDEAFCQGCHSYASVSLDCWDCHNPKNVKTAEDKQ
jgi:hypothetical protein